MKSRTQSKPADLPNLKWRTWAERIQIFDDVFQSLSAVDNGDNLCIRENHLGKRIKIGSRIGAPSRYGEAFQASLTGKRYKLAVKKVLLFPQDRGVSYTAAQLRSGVSAWSELAACMLSSTLVMAKVCNNLPLTYKYTLCDRCHFVNKSIKEARKHDQPCALVINEYAEGDLFMFLEQEYRWTVALVENCLFQIACGLYAMEKYFRGMSHNDLHDGNILVHKIKPGGFWVYKINGKNYYVENLGYVFVLWDFGMAHIPRLIRSGRKLTKGSTDIGQISKNLRAALPNVLQSRSGKYSVIHDLIRLQGKNELPLGNIIESRFAAFRRNVPTKPLILDEFSLDRSIKSLKNAVPSELRQFFTSTHDFDAITHRMSIKRH